MREKVAVQDLLPPDLTIEADFATLGEDQTVEFMNLTSRQTGVEGIVFISTSTNVPHGPRVKYFQKTGKGQPSFSISIASQPRMLASSLPKRVESEMAPKVAEWVRLNRDALFKFWNEGQVLTVDELGEFANRLKKLPSR